MPNYRKQLVLALALFALSALAYWAAYKKQPADEQAKTGSRQPFALKEKEIARFELATPGKTVALECLTAAQKQCKTGDQSKWGLTAPLKAKADDSNAQSFLSAMSTLLADDTIDLASESPEKRAQLLKDYKLDPAQRNATRVVFTFADGSRQAAFFGDHHPIGEAVFTLAGDPAKPNEGKVFLVSEHAIEALQKPLSHWRDKKITNLAQADVVAFSVSGGKKSSPGISGERKEATWALKQGAKNYAGDTDTVDALVTGGLYLTAKDFAAESKASPEGKKALAGAKPGLKLELKTKDKAETIQFYRKTDAEKRERFYVVDSALDPVFEVERGADDRLDKGEIDLRLSKLVPTMDRFGLKWIDIVRKGAKPFHLEIVQKDGKWQGNGRDLRLPPKVDGFLDQLSSQAIADFDQKSAPTAETLEVAVGAAPGQAKYRYLFWKDAGKSPVEKFYARDLLSASKEAFRLNPGISNALPFDEDYFQK